MTSDENPSAGKFGPPPGSEERFSAPQRSAVVSKLTRIGIAVALFRLLIEAYEGPLGQRSVLLVVVLAGLFLAEIVIDMKRADERPNGPYSSPARITR